MGEPAGSSAERSSAERSRELATRTGPGRALIAVYAIFAVAATARSAVQIGTRFDVAPVAFLLSAVAAVVYLVATWCLARASTTNRRIVRVSLAVELAGVLVVGVLSLVDPALFPEPTVWSDFGEGYLFIPIVLPLLGLAWLRHTERT